MTPDWENQAECRFVDSDVFYPSHNDLRGIRDAKRFCERCPVIFECLELALRTNDMHAVMGGTSAVERGRLLARVGYNRSEAIRQVQRQERAYASAT